MPFPADLTSAVFVGVALLVVFFILRVVFKLTRTVFTLGCIGLIILVVLAVLFGGNLMGGAGG